MKPRPILKKSPMKVPCQNVEVDAVVAVVAVGRDLVVRQPKAVQQRVRRSETVVLNAMYQNAKCLNTTWMISS